MCTDEWSLCVPHLSICWHDLGDHAHDSPDAKANLDDCDCSFDATITRKNNNDDHCACCVLGLTQNSCRETSWNKEWDLHNNQKHQSDNKITHQTNSNTLSSTAHGTRARNCQAEVLPFINNCCSGCGKIFLIVHETNKNNKKYKNGTAILRRAKDSSFSLNHADSNDTNHDHVCYKLKSGVLLHFVHHLSSLWQRHDMVHSTCPQGCLSPVVSLSVKNQALLHSPRLTVLCWRAKHKQYTVETNYD